MPLLCVVAVSQGETTTASKKEIGEEAHLQILSDDDYDAEDTPKKEAGAVQDTAIDVELQAVARLAVTVARYCYRAQVITTRQRVSTPRFRGSTPRLSISPQTSRPSAPSTHTP